MRGAIMYFLVGIKGSGMAALALILSDLGYEVAGSDESKYYFTEDKLRERKIKIYPFSKSNIKEGYIYIIGNAFEEGIEATKIKECGYPYYKYHEFIGKFFEGKKIAVSGTHGKTTTTTLLKDMFSAKKICYLIGDASGKGCPNYEYFIFEACEYKNHFLAYSPDVLIINNIELDHVDFFKNVKEVFKSFSKLANQSKIVIVNGDDKYASKIKHHNKITFGFKKKNDAIIEIIDQRNGYIIIIYYNNEKYRFILPFTGLHMIYNFASSFLAALTCGIGLDEINQALINFKLPKRRMNILSYGKSFLVDDYAHHPTEIKALYQALKQKFPNYPLRVIFQSHTYSRTFCFKKDFVKVLMLFDEAYVDKVFSSKREKENDTLEKKVNKAFKMFPHFNLDVLNRIKKDEKAVWIFMGAGTVNEYIKVIK